MSEEIIQKTVDLSLEDSTVLSNKENFESKHPLNTRWTLWYTKPPVDQNESWGDLLKPVITFSTVEEFWGIFNSIPAATDLPIKSDYHLFREGVKPEWEDVANARGGKWAFQFKDKKTNINELWLRALLSVIGETIEDDQNEVNGVVLNVRKQFFRVGLWTKTTDEEKLKPIGANLKRVLKLPETRQVEFLSHEASNQRGAKPSILI
ncbi:hypothetical protein BABINDRAFT_165900 [Babjeviella inositovora NRRL Y-12698]|uniref:Eukaryotic translation initiation factor 4E n=1 Tax=Babjeviella inositovora NRRL Y-12698 TaxID=984486 RepID=A0A1E3QU63_9ASCO|nr:uncharacterized protein BABINDRAFT_165900 [Babjeviella inositovora NRRL Y-12698]ODQ81200.1 hypothetical protein BABINDRAFT_165900 [Babjeviella inositovora NRRL Y-12698]